MIEYLSNLAIWKIFLVVCVLMFTNGLFLFPSSQILLISTGVLTSAIGINPFLIFFLMFFFNLLGNYVLFCIAYFYGEEAAKKLIPIGKKTIDDDILLIKYLFKHYGFLIIFIGRNTPVLHSLVSVPAGIAKMKHSQFLFYTGLGILTWNFAFFYIGRYFGNNYEQLFSTFNLILILITVILTIFSVWFVLHYRKKMLVKAKAEERKHILS